MATMDQLTQLQNDAGVSIQQLIVNTKKAPVERRTLPFYQSRLKELDALWDAFNERDNELRNLPGDIQQCSYFIDDYYNTIRVKVNEIRDEWTKKVLNLSEPSTSSNHTTGASLTSPSNQTATTITKQRIMIAMVKKLLAKVLTTPQASSEYFANQLKLIQQHWKVVQTTHEYLWNNITTVEGSDYNFEEYFLIEAEVQDQMFAIEEKMQADALSAPPASSFALQAIPPRLPHIEIPKFEGDYLKWRQFRDLFEEMVHKQPLPMCQKMWYLKSSVTGGAATLIQHFTATASNYEAAWNIINERYENPRLLVNAVLTRLLSQKFNTEHASGIKGLHDVTQECLLSLQNLGISTTTWDPILLHLLVQQLHKSSHALWEQSLPNPNALPSLDCFLNFLKNRFQSLEAMGSRTSKEASYTGRVTSAAATYKGNCIACKGHHALFTCPTFLKLVPHERLKLVQTASLCANCLKKGHKTKLCPSSCCTICQRKHNTLLHLGAEARSAPQESKPINQKAVSLSVLPDQPQSRSTVMLSTVCILVTNKNGEKISCRALLDGGSQVNLMTKEFANKLGFKTTVQKMEIDGVGETISQAAERVNVEIASTNTAYNNRLEAHILPKIVPNQPNNKLNIAHWKIPQNIQLADPSFYLPGKIDMLIGAGIFYPCLCVGQIKLGKQLPILQKTLFGWVVAGELSTSFKNNPYCGVGLNNQQLNANLEKFWQVEEREHQSNNFTAAENQCEKHYLHNVRRDKDGRFIVRLPFLMNSDKLGDSSKIAMQRFLAIERKLQRDPNLRTEYIKFMREYEKLNHMHEVSPASIKGPHFFLPHHAVLKPSSTTTKVRIVFDASAKTSTNFSLNDLLAKGPTIQADVFTILIRFRFPRFAFTADIEKMYRQIWVDKEDQKYQLIWWREDPSQKMRCMRLSTVTYGTTSAPYLAIRTLQQLAITQGSSFPLAASAIKNNFYVDDVLYGSDTISGALEQQAQLRSLLKSAGLNLRKWCANDVRLLQEIPVEDREVSLDVSGQQEETIKTMGLMWQPKSDMFNIKVNIIESRVTTKRTALADISRIFDPLGLLAPVVVIAKIFLQELWKLKLDWDAAIPQELHTKWKSFSQALPQLEQISINRHIFNHKTIKKYEVHVFADASEKAYGAAVYIRSVDKSNTIIVRLLCSKSRVAPVKQITLPRLELCAADLAVNLVKQLQEQEILNTKDVFYWSDSTAVLGWIQATSSNYHTFVANRISFIQQHSSPQQWHHVESQQNPADLISRGVFPDQLINNPCWLYGPMFLHKALSSWPLQPPLAKCELELRASKLVSATVLNEQGNLIDTIHHKNSLIRLKNILGYVLRFIKSVSRKGKPQSKLLTIQETDEALGLLIKIAQKGAFAADIHSLKNNKCLANKSNLSSLSPFLDDKGILRVGGRLQAADINFDTKHPMLLPYHHNLTKMIFKEEHETHLHVGPQALLSIVRQRFWPLNGKNIARSIVNGCVTCAKARPKMFQQMMGSLPKDRIQPARPFVNSGVDFFGPLWIHFKLRGRRPVKAYVAVFCCFATKAVHMELVSDLSTDAFLGALQRFIARRGHCSKLFCDNATNFVGAHNKLEEIKESLYSNNAQEKIVRECNKRCIDFKFIPPRAPHFGGLWEAAVKSAKTLLQSTMSAANLTQEEITTLLAQAEAILNSRPLTPLSADANDVAALTPGHLLIGEPLTTIVDPYAQQSNAKLLDRWKLVSQLKEQFWRRWSNEYLHTLQNRYKWKKGVVEIQPNTMVVIKEDNLPPCQWALGRITNVIRGEDGIIRVADVKTSTNIIRRPIVKLAPLPIESEIVPPTSEAEISLSTQKPETTQTTRVETRSSVKQKSASDQNDKPRKRAKTSATPLTTALLLVCLLLPLCFAKDVEVEAFSKNSVLYFEKLGDVGIVTSEWNLISYVNMSNYWDWSSRMQEFPNILAKCCKQSGRESCMSTTSLINHLVQEFTIKNNLLRHNKLPRNKRGAINIIGNAANALFGVLDEQYARETSETIAKIHQDEKHIMAELKNQRSFLDSTISIVKQEEHHIEAEFKKIETYLSQTANQIGDVQRSVNAQKEALEFNELAMQISLTMTYVRQIQDSLLDILTDTHHGRINTELIPPSQLANELANIKAHLPSSLKLPTNTDNLLALYHLLTIKARIVNEVVIFNIQVPLVLADVFELLKITQIPFATNDGFAQIQTNYRFLIINLHRDQYTPLEQEDNARCQSIERDYYICYHIQSIYSKDSDVAACELNVLNQRNSSKLCKQENIGYGPHWIQLHNPNQWLFATNKNLSLNTVCDNTLNTINIQNTGILKLNGNCVIRQSRFTIRSFRTYQVSENRVYLPEIEMNKIMSDTKTETARIGDRFVSHYKAKTEELQAIRDAVEQPIPDLQTNLNAHDIHHYSVGYICLIATFVIATYLWYKKRSKVIITPRGATDNTDNIVTIAGCTNNG